MGRFGYWMNVSLDLRIEQVPGEKGAGDWLRIGEYNAQARALALMVEGRVSYSPSPRTSYPCVAVRSSAADRATPVSRVA
jgi:hypothetical protein